VDVRAEMKVGPVDCFRLLECVTKDWTDRQTDRQTDTRPLLYSYQVTAGSVGREKRYPNTAKIFEY